MIPLDCAPVTLFSHDYFENFPILFTALAETLIFFCRKRIYLAKSQNVVTAKCVVFYGITFQCTGPIIFQVCWACSFSFAFKDISWEQGFLGMIPCARHSPLFDAVPSQSCTVDRLSVCSMRHISSNTWMKRVRNQGQGMHNNYWCDPIDDVPMKIQIKH